MYAKVSKPGGNRHPKEPEIFNPLSTHPSTGAARATLECVSFAGTSEDASVRPNESAARTDSCSIRSDRALL